jgi:hypothetical protein
MAATSSLTASSNHHLPANALIPPFSWYTRVKLGPYPPQCWHGSWNCFDANVVRDGTMIGCVLPQPMMKIQSAHGNHHTTTKRKAHCRPLLRHSACCGHHLQPSMGVPTGVPTGGNTLRQPRQAFLEAPHPHQCDSDRHGPLRPRQAKAVGFQTYGVY